MCDSDLLNTLKQAIADRDALFKDIDHRMRNLEKRFDLFSERLKDQQEPIKANKSDIQHLFSRIEQLQKIMPPTQDFSGYDVEE